MTGPSVRSTRQRAAISSLLETLDEFRSAQELHDELRRRGENIGLTTVYRALQSMAAAGVSLCLYYLSHLTDVMEKVVQLPHDVVDEVVECVAQRLSTA